MSNSGQLSYMSTNEDFDLPRWQTQAHLEPLSSTAQAAQSAIQSSYLYTAPPPSSSTTSATTQRPPIQQAPPTSARQPSRISQLLEDNHTLSNPSSYNQGAQLSRSASFGGMSAGLGSGSGATTSSTATRGRRHHQQDDLEGAFTSDAQASTNRQNSINSASQHPFYNPSIAYHSANASPNPGTSLTGEAYQDMFFNNTKRPQAVSDSSRAPRSPIRVGNPSTATHLDPYSQQSQYSPTAPSYQYNSASGTAYSSHVRNNSQVKAEPITPPPLAYSPMQTNQTTNATFPPPPYKMEASSPKITGLPNSQTHLNAPPSQRQGSASSPSTPLSYNSSQASSSQYYAQDQPMDMSPTRQRRASGFRRVRDPRDLRPQINSQVGARRVDASGVPLSSLRQLTTGIVDTYHICNPAFRYESAHNPRRVLTKPSKACHNDGCDNEDFDYILYVNDWLGTEDGHKYLILDILGQGTFGQVVKCQNMKTHEVVAVKVVKNKPAYFNQSMMEVTILEMLNKNHDPQDEHHILRLRDSFIHRNHLCLVFELLSSNLYELIKQNQFQGLSTQLVKVFTAQLLDALTVLKEARLIHCDLKPENILLKSLQSPQIKVIDFGSACHERQTVYTYIQSRFYRSPEVLLGIPYTAAIDMWSLGCIAVELFLGLPLFPGTSEYNQITRIVDMLGMPPSYMLDMGKQTSQFFDSFVDVYGLKKYRLKTLEQYSREHNTNEQPGKQYFKANSLPEIIRTAPMPSFKSSTRQGHEMEKELNNRASFIDFCQGLLNLNPIERWSPQQARMHPFITGEKFTKPFVPPGQNIQQQPPSSPSSAQDPKRPYGGLVPSQPKGTRAYQDAATYNQHLAQHQAFTAQAQAASQAANNSFRNPYIAQAAAAQSQDSANSNFSNTQSHQAQFSAQPQTGARGVAHQNPPGQLVVNTSISQYPTQGSQLNPNPPSSTYFPSSRARANTINQMDAVPPALARLQHMNQDVIQGGRNALTPVLNRDDALREWERRQSGKAAAPQPYPQLEYLHQQAEMVAASGLAGWTQPANRYPPPPSKLSQSFHPQTVVVDEDRRDAVMSNVRSAARGDGPAALYGTSAPITAPAQTYSATSTTSGNRYAPTYSAQQTPTSPFDSVDQRAEIGSMYVPMQPNQYQPPYNREAPPPPSAAQPLGGTSTNRHIVPPSQTVSTSFYGAGVVPAGQASAGTQQRNPFSGTMEASQLPKETTRRGTNMDVWPR